MDCLLISFVALVGSKFLFEKLQMVEMYSLGSSTVSFTNFDRCKRAVSFESILITLEASFVFLGSWGSRKNWLEHKIDPLLDCTGCISDLDSTLIEIFIIFNHF